MSKDRVKASSNNGKYAESPENAITHVKESRDEDNKPDKIDSSGDTAPTAICSDQPTPKPSIVDNNATNEPKAAQQASNQKPKPKASVVEPAQMTNRRTTVTEPDLECQLRDLDDSEPRNRWFASTLTPPLAAAIAPIANVFSIAAVAAPWKVEYMSNARVDATARAVVDPKWCIALKALSLATAALGTLTLLALVFGRLRYIIGMPTVTALWLISSGFLIGATASINAYSPPLRPRQTYSQGFWYAVIAAVVYFAASTLLAINLRGYFRGYYPSTLTFTRFQKQSITQAILFSFWLAIWAAAFSRVGHLSFVDALYFCEINLLTVGYGGIPPPNNGARAMVIPLTAGGVLLFGMLLSTTNSVLREITDLKLIWQASEEKRRRLLAASTTGDRPSSSAPPIAHLQSREALPALLDQTSSSTAPLANRHSSFASPHIRPRGRKALVLREEKDRFEAMRHIQNSTSKFKTRWVLVQSCGIFCFLWLISAIVFWKVEADLTYFEALYFCFVALLTIGSGDIFPVSNAGKPFFVVWSLIAVSATTIFVGNLSEAVIRLGIGIVEAVKKTKEKYQRKRHRKNHATLVSFQVDEPRPESSEGPLRRNRPSIDDFRLGGREQQSGEHDLALRLSLALKRATDDMQNEPQKKYSYEEWQEFFRLTRFTTGPDYEYARRDELDELGETNLIEWDWIGEDSPILGNSPEPEFVVEQLFRSMTRYIRRQRYLQKERGEAVKNVVRSMMEIEKGGSKRRRHSVSSF